MNYNNLSSEEFDELIVKKCPLLYRDRYANMQATAMCWGFEIGKGWHNLIWELSSKIEKILETLPAENRPCASQVKSKYGGLRFYMTCSTEEINKLTDEAESKSMELCELCGDPGKEYGGGWVETLCLKHATKDIK